MLYPKDLESLLKPSEHNPSPVTVPPPMPGLAKQQWQQRFVAPVFGLPMRGKAHTARELKRFIQFFHGARAEIFDLNNYLEPGGDDRLYSDVCNFFHITEQNVPDAYDHDCSGTMSGGFAIILGSDEVVSTKSMWSAHTKWHRRWMSRMLQEKLGAEICFIQISVDDAFGEQYIADLCRFRGKSIEESKAQILRFQDHFVPLQDDGSEGDTPYIKIQNYNQMMVVNKVMQGFVGSEVCHFLSNLHPYTHTVYLSRHGESQFNVEKRIGGDSSLSKRGEEYARRLAEFVKYVQCGRADNLVCITLTPQEVQALPERLRAATPDTVGWPIERGVFTGGSWEGYGDASGAVVEEGMQLVRLQAGYGSDFRDAPETIAEVVEAVGSSLATLVFVRGDTSEPGRVPGRLWTSSLRRTIETGGFIDHSVVPYGEQQWTQMVTRKMRSLDEVYAGEYDGLTEADIKKMAPEIAAARAKDKLGFRYPRGESYYDIIARLSAAMVNLERIREPILVISHQAVLRLIYAWMTVRARDEALKLAVPQHEVIRISYDGLGGPRVERRFPLGPTRLMDDGQSNL